MQAQPPEAFASALEVVRQAKEHACRVEHGPPRGDILLQAPRQVHLLQEKDAGRPEGRTDSLQGPGNVGELVERVGAKDEVILLRCESSGGLGEPELDPVRDARLLRACPGGVEVGAIDIEPDESRPGEGLRQLDQSLASGATDVGGQSRLAELRLDCRQPVDPLTEHLVVVPPDAASLHP